MSLDLTKISEIEKERFQNSINLICRLFSNKRKEEIVDTYLEERIADIQILDRLNGEEEGYIEEADGEDTYTVAYLEYNYTKPIESYHQSIHELIHILGTPNTKNVTYENTGKECFGGLEIIENQDKKLEYYGHAINEGCDEILTKMALSQVEKYDVDDVMLSNNVKFESGYKVVVPIVRLLAFAMNNEFYKSYSELIKDGLGIVDRTVTFQNYDNNFSVKTNDLFCGMAIDPLYTEKRFNMYTNDGEYKKFNMKLDKVLKEDKALKEKGTVNAIKEVMISISNMFYNKIYLYKENELIDKELYDIIIYKYDVLLNDICKYYSEEYDVEIEFDRSEREQMFENYNTSKNILK